MALYRAETKPLSRKDGRSSVAASAYRAGVVLVNQRIGNTHDYTRRHGVVATGIMTPDGQGYERNALWNGAEAAEKRKDARTAREWVLALPAELNDAQRLALTEEFSQSLVERFGVAVDFALHRPGREGDQRNHHAHVLVTTRKVSRGEGGVLLFGEKAQPELSDAQLRKLGIEKGAVLVEEVRALWERQVNAALEEAGEVARVDRRCLKARGIDRMPTIHLGPAVTALERHGRPTEAGQVNQVIEQDNERRAVLKTEIIDLKAERKRRRIKAARAQEQKRRDDIGVREECDGYLKARKPFTLESLLKQAVDELAQGEVGLRKGIVRDTPDYARKIKEIRDLEAEIRTKERHLEAVRYRLTECEEEISEWAEGVGFFARLFPPHEIRETKERIVEAQSDLHETTGLLSLLKAAFEQAKKLFKEWFLTEVNSPKLEDRWRWRSQALIGIQHECEAKLAKERKERAKAREVAELKRFREEEARWKAQQAEKAQKSKEPVVEPKQEIDSLQFGVEVPDDDDWDDSPSFGM